MAIKKVINSRDGHIYYVVESDGENKTYVGVFFLDNYDQLSEHLGEWGLWFVRDAAADDTGQHGDPTVHEGWAMYTWDNYKKVYDNDGNYTLGGWRKVSEQESVDGPWGIDEKILKKLVTKVEFNLAINALDARLVIVEDRSSSNEQKINTMQEAIDVLESKAHTHDNKSTLDAITDTADRLNYKGTPISNTFIYENIVDGDLVWKNPLDSSAAAVTCANSYAVACEFAKTALCFLGMTIEVVEVDGSISRYDFTKNGTTVSDIKHRIKYSAQINAGSGRTYYKYDGTNYTVITAEDAATILNEGTDTVELYYADAVLIPVFSGTSLSNPSNLGGVTYVSTLPEASVVYDNRGIWIPMLDDGTHEPGKPYVSNEGIWSRYASDEGKTITTAGATFTIAYAEDDPSMPFKKNHLFWTEPDDDSENNKFWLKSIIVRKFGSASASVNDGVVIHTATDRTEGPAGIIDHCPFSDEQVYYTIFSTTRSGALYTTSSSVAPKNMDWTYLFNLLDKESLIQKVVDVGDTIVMPYHPTFGAIECEVINVTALGIDRKITVATKIALDSIAFGESSDYSSSTLKNWLNSRFDCYTQFVPTTDHQAVEGTTYYTFDANTGYTELSISAGEDMPEGVMVFVKDATYPKGIISGSSIPDPDNTLGYTNITKEKHVGHLIESTDWWTSKANGDTVVTGNSTDGVDPTDELGVVVVFTIAKQS